MTDLGCPQHWKKRLYSWGDDPEPQEATTFPCEHLETPEPKEPAEWSDTPRLSALQPQHKVPVVTSIGTPEEPGTGLDPGIKQPQIH